MAQMKRWIFFTGIILIVAAAASVVFAGRHNDNSSTQANSSQTKSDPSEGGKYLYIKEWGVRFKLDPNLIGETLYAVKTNVDIASPAQESAGGPMYGDVAYFSTKQLADLAGSSCVVNAAENQYGGRVGISRSTVQPQPAAASDIHIGNYWYRAEKSGGGACSPDSDGTAESKFVSEIISSSKSLEAVN